MTERAILRIFPGVFAAGCAGALLNYFAFSYLEPDVNAKILGLAGGFLGVASIFTQGFKGGRLGPLKTGLLDSVRKDSLDAGLEEMEVILSVRKRLAWICFFLVLICGVLVGSAKIEIWRPVLLVYGYELFFVAGLNAVISWYEHNWANRLITQIERKEEEAARRAKLLERIEAAGGSKVAESHQGQ